MDFNVCPNPPRIVEPMKGGRWVGSLGWRIKIKRERVILLRLFIWVIIIRVI